MGKADEERLAIGVQKYPCLYDKAVSEIIKIIMKIKRIMLGKQ